MPSAYVQFDTMPRAMVQASTQIMKDDAMSVGVAAMMERKNDFRSELAAMLVGIAADPQSRRHMNEAMDAMWAKNSPLVKGTLVDELVIGGGLHAAIYCAIRVQKGFPKPMVLESTGRVGGALGRTTASTFWLNSRNRPGDIGAPGDLLGALNVLPGAPIQPSDLSSDEYQRNSDIAFVIRTTLAMYADVYPNQPVYSIERNYGAASGTYRYIVKTNSGRVVRTNRIILATGLGGDNWPHQQDEEKVLTFGQFMDHMDQRFPLRGLNRVAVIGCGDSGKTAVEALVGQGPNEHWSMASLDYPSRIEWWSQGLASLYYKKAWETTVRSRYKGLGRLMPRSDTTSGDTQRRLLPIRKNVSYVDSGYGVALVDDRVYDLVIDCRGFNGSSGISMGFPQADQPFAAQSRVVATKPPNENIYKVGPAANIAARATESAAVPENATSLFRYADRTATLAATLPAPRR